jgi:hypothetical protein
MNPPTSPRREVERMRGAILAWLFPVSGTVVLLIAFLLALFAR